MQGDGAEESLISALDYLDRSHLCDVIIIGRGGGSIEDLWAFNSEKLARRIYAATTPIISAVGHETDFTICDFVADMRAPTPSAAAEIAVPDKRELLLRIDGYNERIFSALNRRVERAKEKLLIYSDKVSEKALLNILSAKADAVAKLEKDANIFISIYLERQKESLAQNAAKADALSPLSTLFRGYSIAETKNGIIKSISDVKDGDDFTLIVSDGKIGGKVTKIENGDINS